MATSRLVEADGLGDGRLILPGSWSTLLRVMGAFFTIAGAGTLWAAFVQNSAVDNAAAVVGVAGIFLVPGLIMLLHVARRVIDRNLHQVEIVWGVGVPLFRKVLSLDAFDQVRMDAIRVRTQSGGSQTQYRVSLAAEGATPCPLWTATRYAAARRRAEQVARFVGFPLADHTGGTVSVRPPDALDQPAVERWRVEGAKPPRTSLPAGSRLEVRKDDGALVVSLPATGLTGPVGFALLAGLPGLVIPLVLWQSGFVPIASPWVFVVLLAVLEGPVVMLILWFAAGRERVRVDKHGVTVTRRIGPLRRTVHIPAAELEELVERSYRNSPLMGNWSGGIALCSDARTCTFGVSLDRRDRDWLAGAIRAAMTR